MKKVLSLVLALFMFASMSTVALAADFDFELVLWDADLENEVAEVNVGDTFYLTVDCSTKTSKWGVELSIDTTNFEIAQYEDGGEYADDVDFGSFTGAYVINPNGSENTISIGGVKTGKTAAISATLGFVAKTAGTYTIAFKGQQDKNMPDGAVSTGNALTLVVKGGEPEGPTAETLGLFTDASQNFKITENVMTSNGWSINKALAFVSGIYADADVITFGTEITCEGYDNVLDIPAANTYEAATNVKGFVAAVTSIRNDNLTKTFTAKAYADVTVDGETTRIYAENAASAVYGN
jgi:hypothetical protein